MPSIIPSVTLITTINGIKLKPMQKIAPKKLFLAEDFFSVFGEIKDFA